MSCCTTKRKRFIHSKHQIKVTTNAQTARPTRWLRAGIGSRLAWLRRLFSSGADDGYGADTRHTPDDDGLKIRTKSVDRYIRFFFLSSLFCVCNVCVWIFKRYIIILVRCSFRRIYPHAVKCSQSQYAKHGIPARNPHTHFHIHKQYPQPTPPPPSVYEKLPLHRVRGRHFDGHNERLRMCEVVVVVVCVCVVVVWAVFVFAILAGHRTHSKKLNKNQCKLYSNNICAGTNARAWERTHCTHIIMCCERCELFCKTGSPVWAQRYLAVFACVCNVAGTGDLHMYVSFATGWNLHELVLHKQNMAIKPVVIASYFTHTQTHILWIGVLFRSWSVVALNHVKPSLCVFGNFTKHIIIIIVQ